jgi:hypothetical protein
MKMLRSIRLDPSDTFVFERAAEPGEWAVPGSFLFMEATEETIAALAGKARAAFRSGFVGTASLGFTTLVTVVEASAKEREQAIEELTRRFVDTLGAPDLAVARLAATEEIDFSVSVADHPVGTLVALHRSLGEDGIREQFRVLHQREANVGADAMHSHARAFVIVADDDGEEAVPEEHVDLIGLARETGA